MATRMGKRTCTVTRLAQRARHLEQEIRSMLERLDMIDRQKHGRFVGHTVELVSVSGEEMTVIGDVWAAENAARLFRQARLHNVDVYQHPTRPCVWIASGAVQKPLPPV